MRKHISRFKEHYDLIQHGEYYRLTAVAEGQCTVWEMVDLEGREALVSAVYHHVGANEAPVIVKVRGLKAESWYQIHLYMDDMEKLDDWARYWFERQLSYGYRDGEKLTGAALGQCGLVIPEPMEEFQAWQIHIVEVS